MRQHMKFLFPGLIGNFLEWYEFSIYAYFAKDLAEEFFPNNDPFIALLNTFAIFAIGFVMRPVGAAVFGYFADRLGRKKILPISIIMMALATAFIGCIPSYASIGSLAAILLILCRLVQGVALGGEYSSALVYVLEQTPHKQRGFYGSIVLFGAYMGMLFGSGMSALIATIAYGTMYYNFAWRSAFIFGLFLGVLGLYLRLRMPETEEFIRAKQEGMLERNPFIHLLRYHLKSVLCGVGITLLPAVTGWLVFAYVPTYVAQYGQFTEPLALDANTCAMVSMMVCIPLVGFLSDRLGRRFFLASSSILLLCFAYPLFGGILGSSWGVLLFAQTLLGIMLTLSESVLPATLMTLFPVSERCTGIALSINIANGLFGGMVPLLATELLHATNVLLIPSFIVIAVAMISGLTLWLNWKKFAKQWT
jgi:MHS family proline/betaine transporter-like MFS transporter